MKAKQKKKKRTARFNRLQTRLIILIIFCVVGAVCFNGYRTYVKSQEYKQQAQELDMEIAQAEAKKEELARREEYMKTDAYKEEVAREEFGMIKKGEYILKDKNQ